MSITLRITSAEPALGPIEELVNHEFQRKLRIRWHDGLTHPELVIELRSTHEAGLRLEVERVPLAVADEMLCAARHRASAGPETLLRRANSLRAACGLPAKE